MIASISAIPESESSWITGKVLLAAYHLQDGCSTFLPSTLVFPAKAGERHHHRGVVAGPLQHGEGAADLRGAGHGGVRQAPGGARNTALLPRAGLLLRQGQSSTSEEEEEEERRLQLSNRWRRLIQL